MPKCNACDQMSLPEVERNRCGENFGQVQITAFFDLQKSGSPTPAWAWADLMAMTTGEDPEMKATLKATYTSLIGSGDAALSPLMFSPNLNPGGEITWGGGNSTPDGKIYVIGKEPSEFTTELRKATAAQQEGMEKMQCLAESDRLGAIFFDGDGNVMGSKVDPEGNAVTTGIAPIKITKCFISDLAFGNRESPDYNSLSLQLPEGWSADRKVIALKGFRGQDLIAATL